jgi:predicted lipid-binding transport protein (Tim44 family)
MHVAPVRGMSVKSKARRTRRAKPESTAPAAHATPHLPANPEEKRAAGAIMGALLDAITFGALETSPASARAVERAPADAE